MNELTGTVKQIFEEQTFGSGFNKREFVVTDDADKYPQDIKFECVKEAVGQYVDNLNEGDKVKVLFNLRGNEYQGKYYVNLQAWKVEVTSKPQRKPEPVAADFADDPLDETPPF